MSSPPRSPVIARRKLPEPLSIARMAFTPDGQALVIERQGETEERLAFTVPGLRPTNVPPGEEACGFTGPAVRRRRGGGKRCLVIPSTPGGQEMLSIRLLGGYVSDRHAISRDRRLAAAICGLLDAFEEPRKALWVVRLPEGSPRAALPINSPLPLLEVAIAPDGATVAAVHLEEVILLDVEAVLRAERQHEEAFDRIPKRTIAELKSICVRGLTLRDFFTVHASSRTGIVALETPVSGLLAGFWSFESARRGEGAPEPPHFVRKEGRLWPDILQAQPGVQLLSSRAIAALERHGLTGWRAHPVTIEDPGVPAPYFGIEVLAEPLRSLREIEYADPAEHQVGRCVCDLSAWAGEDFVRLTGSGGLYATRRVLEAFQKEDLRGWKARDLLQEEPRLEGPPPLAARPKGRVKRARSPSSTRIVASCWDARKVARQLDEADLQRVREAAIRAMRPAWGLLTRPAELDDLPAGGSHLGGSPDLPADAAWPSGANGPLSFLGQLRVEDLGALDAERLLPAAGLFSFFLDVEDGGEGAAKVLYTAPGTSLERRSPPPGAQPRTFLPCALELRAFPSLPDDESNEVERWKLSANEADAYRDLRTDLYEAHGLQADRVHQVFGHPTSLGDDVFRLAADDGSRWPVGESRLLLQLDEDDQLGTEWGDSGRIYLVLPAPALRALRLDRVVHVFQCR